MNSTILIPRWATLCLWTMVVAISTYVSSCGYNGPVITVHELKNTIDDSRRNITVIDVRPEVQFNKGHIPGAINYPLESLEQTWTEIASIKGNVAIICTCGKRSLAAIKLLAAKGIATTLVEGGMKKWETAKYPLEKSN